MKNDDNYSICLCCLGYEKGWILLFLFCGLSIFSFYPALNISHNALVNKVNEIYINKRMHKNASVCKYLCIIFS